MDLFLGAYYREEYISFKKGIVFQGRKDGVVKVVPIYKTDKRFLKNVLSQGHEIFTDKMLQLQRVIHLLLTTVDRLILPAVDSLCRVFRLVYMVSNWLARQYRLGNWYNIIHDWILDGWRSISVPFANNVNISFDQSQDGYILSENILNPLLSS